MKRSKRKKKKKILVVFILLIIVLIAGIVGYKFVFNNTELTKKDNNVMINLVGKDIKNANKLTKKYDLDLTTDYNYDDKLAKDKIISQSIKAGKKIKKKDKLEIVVSLGKLDKEKLASDKINELGKVPIMMYHGIENITDNKYTGGNIDSSGYNRTSDAFKKDLEKYFTEGYQMLSLKDYIAGNITTEYGKSPIVLTFDDGNANNIKVTGIDDKGEIIIDENSAVGILETFKKKYPNFNVTATFFVNAGLFNQPEYDEKIMHWLIKNNYDIGNHTASHINIGKSSPDTIQREIGSLYDKLEKIISNDYVKIIALPFGSPYKKEDSTFNYVLNTTYNGKEYQTEAALRVGWEPEISSYDKSFDKTFMKRCRAYDNNGKDFDIEMVFNLLKETRYISDGNVKTIVTSADNKTNIIETDKDIITY